MPAASPRQLEQAVDGVTAARLAGVQRLQRFDGVGGLAVEPAGALVIQEVAKIGADDDKGAVVAGKDLQHFSHRSRRCLAYDQGDQLEIVERYLEEGQVHLQAMFGGVGLIEEDDLGQVEQTLDGLAVHGHFSQGRGKGIGTAGCKTAHGDAVGRPEQDDMPDDISANA